MSTLNADDELSPLEVRLWLAERLANCQRIAATKRGPDRAGWLEDARFFRAAFYMLSDAQQREPASAAPRDPHPTWRECCEQLETALAAALELKRRAAQPECERDFAKMPTYVQVLHAKLFAALPTSDFPLPT